MSSLILRKNWSSLIKPESLHYEQTSDFNIRTTIIEPLEKGFGLTLGNALRRVLLSSLQGTAITAVKIPGVMHELSSIPGVKEDLTDIILNLKEVVIKLDSAEPKTLRLKATGPACVTAGMIQAAHDIEILNPQHVICTLNKGFELEMELTCEQGKGYIPVNHEKDKSMAIGVVPIDAIFSPVKKVSYKVENARVGQDTEYDKLLLTVETNGVISPETALGLSARILQDQLQLFVNFKEKEEVEEKPVESLSFNPLLLKKVEELDLTVRAQNCLRNVNIVYIGDLVVKTEADMLKTQNFGRKSLNEIKAILAGYKLKFGMEVPDWPPENLENMRKNLDDPFN